MQFNLHNGVSIPAMQPQPTARPLRISKAAVAANNAQAGVLQVALAGNWYYTSTSGTELRCRIVVRAHIPTGIFSALGSQGKCGRACPSSGNAQWGYGGGSVPIIPQWQLAWPIALPTRGRGGSQHCRGLLPMPTRKY